ncbi:GntR family transcriptional regulator [Massilia oculi]|uniref:GntR family transcriptional regulator n=1 Tax=Massilia hydrophila TaxID=3044279 RepID=A0ABS7YCE1_9BURK|nr:GntR family transcriptional regulator [Massilia oculi]MCA1857356.1 GntR family transcriptional regulator [Massilia oculi]
MKATASKKNAGATTAQPRHRYRQVAQELIDAITAGTYPVDSFLPTEKILCEHYGISRYTAREALDVVEAAGLIERRQGSGSVVVSNTPPVHYNHNVQNIDDLLQYGNASRLRALESKEVLLDEEPARFLKSNPGAKAILLSGVRHQRNDERVFSFTRIYFVTGSAAVRKALLDPERSVLTMLKMLDLKNVDHIEQAFSATGADRETAQALGCAEGAPVFRTDRVYVDRRGKVVLYAASWHPGHLFSYSTVLQRA